MSVKIVKFNCHGCFAPAYGCSLPGDNSGDYVLHSAYSAIKEERDKLAQEVMRLVNINEQLHERYNALVEAVAWERECQAFTYRAPLSIDAMKELLLTRYAARAEVDRLLGES